MMGFSYPIKSEQPAPPQPGIFGALMDILNAPGTDALMGGPWGAVGKVINVFHGTHSGNVSSILENGLNTSRFGTGADAPTSRKGWYGKGVYVTENPKVAEAYADDTANRSGTSPVTLPFQLEDNTLFRVPNGANYATPDHYPWEQIVPQLVQGTSVNPDKLLALRNTVLGQTRFFRGLQSILQRQGYDGTYMTPHEIVVYNPNIITPPKGVPAR